MKHLPGNWKNSVREVEIIGVCDNAEKALVILSTEEVDLAFLDIEMPHMNGFELLQRLKKIPFEIIFTTAYDMFAVKPLSLARLDYLLKPIDKDELIQAVEKVKEKKNADNLTGTIEHSFSKIL